MRIEFFMPMIPPTADVEWRPIPGFGDKYLISSAGMVQNGRTGQILKSILKNDGYRAGGNKWKMEK